MLCNESVHINCITKFHDDIVLAAITASDVSGIVADICFVHVANTIMRYEK